MRTTMRLGWSWLAVALVAAVLLPGCGGKDMDELRVFLKQPRSPVAVTEYRVLPPDVIAISSIHVPEINGVSQRIRPDGKVNLPLLGEVYVAEKTPKEIEETLMAASKSFYEQVDARVQVVGYNSQFIYVFGQVARPGPVPFTGGDTLLDVLARVQPTDLAWPERIKLIRGKGPKRGGYPYSHFKAKSPAALAEDPKAETKPAEGEPAEGDVAKAEPAGPAAAGSGTAAMDDMALVGADATAMRINLWDMVKKGDLSQNVLLEPGDTIYVQPNPLAKVGLAIQQLLFPVRPFGEVVSTPASLSSGMTMP